MIVAATGHRPQFLPCSTKRLVNDRPIFSIVEDHKWLVSVRARLLDWLQFQNPTKVITGMALGWDTIVADAALQLGIPFDAYCPFPGQPTRWSKADIQHYNYLLDKADNIKMCSKYYSNQAYLKRDEAMVNDADGVIALWNPEQKTGGTFYTVKYAKRLSKPVTNFWE